MTNYIPLLMGDKPIGKINVDPETGEFTGSFDPKLLEIIRNGFSTKMLSVSFMTQPEPPRSVYSEEDYSAVEKQHADIKAYLEEPGE